MKLQFIGVGSAFTTQEYYQSNMLVHASSGKKLLIDCGSDARFALTECGVEPRQIDAVYISHLHADHIGSLEWFAFMTYFDPRVPRPKLFMEQDTMHDLWRHSLSGGLGCIGEKLMHLTDYFECHALRADGQFVWEGIRFTLHRMPHILNGFRNHYSYGLHVQPVHNAAQAVFITTDTLLEIRSLQELNPTTRLFFHDCETSPFPTGVHAHYRQLCELPADLKAKTWLYHYQPHPPYDPEADGLLGFVRKGQYFDLCV